MCNKYRNNFFSSLTLRKRRRKKINFRPHSSLRCVSLQHVTNLYQSHTCSQLKLNLFHVNFFSALGDTYWMQFQKLSLSLVCNLWVVRHHLHIIIVIMNFLCKLFVSGGKNIFSYCTYPSSYFFFFLRISRNILSHFLCMCVDVFIFF